MEEVDRVAADRVDRVAAGWTCTGKGICGQVITGGARRDLSAAGEVGPMVNASEKVQNVGPLDYFLIVSHACLETLELFTLSFP